MWVAFACCTVIAAAQTAADPRPTLLVVEPREDTAPVKPARRFVSQLRLVVDEFQILPVTFEGEEFDQQPLADEVTAVRERLAREKSRAAVWLTRTDDLVLLHVLALRADTVDLRTVSAKRTRDVETVLALMVRELLIGGYVNASGSDLDLWQKVVARLEPSEASAAADSAPPDTSAPVDTTPSLRPPWRTALGAQGASGLTGMSSGGAVAWGGLLAAERDLGSAMVAGLALTSNFRPKTHVPSGHIDSWDLSCGAYAGYRLFADSPIELLPIVGVAASWTRYGIALGTGPETHTNYWNLIWSIGLEGRWHISRRVALGLRPEATIRSFLAAFSRRSDGEVVFKEPSVSGRLLAALYFSWP